GACGPAGWQGGDPRVLQAPRCDPRPTLSRLLPIDRPEGRTGARTEQHRRLPLSSRKRDAVSRRPGDARPPRRPEADRYEHVSAHLRDRHAIRRDEVGAEGRRMNDGPGPPGDAPIVLAMTGASGAPYAVELLRTLNRAGRIVHLSISPSGAQVLQEET